VALFEGADPARAVRSGHTVVIPLMKEDAVSDRAIHLSRPRRATVKEALLGMGLPDDRAETLATLGRRSLLALRRARAFSPAVQQPVWALPDEARAVLPALLAGAWVGGRAADRDTLASLAARPYEQVEQDVTRLAQNSDPPIGQIGVTWLLASKEDAWTLLHRYLTAGDLQRFETVAGDALGRNDAAGPDIRSGILREGIAAQGEALRAAGQRVGAQLARLPGFGRRTSGGADPAVGCADGPPRELDRGDVDRRYGWAITDDDPQPYEGHVALI